MKYERGADGVKVLFHSLVGEEVFFASAMPENLRAAGWVPKEERNGGMREALDAMFSERSEKEAAGYFDRLGKVSCPGCLECRRTIDLLTMQRDLASAAMEREVHEEEHRKVKHDRARIMQGIAALLGFTVDVDRTNADEFVNACDAMFDLRKNEVL